MMLPHHLVVQIERLPVLLTTSGVYETLKHQGDRRVNVMASILKRPCMDPLRHVFSLPIRRNTRTRSKLGRLYNNALYFEIL